MEFKFPEEEELTLFLKDILEDEVDEKYYLSDEQTEKLLYPEKYNLSSFRQRNLIKGDVCQTLQAAMSHGNTIPLILQVNNPKHSNNRVYLIEGISPTLNTMQGGNRQPFILIKNATKKGYLEGYPGDGVNLEQPNSETRRGRIQKDVIGCLQTNDQRGVITEDLRIRKLTPKECFRLMGFLNDKINLDGLSNTQRYKLSGNGWDINLVSKILKEMNLPDNFKTFEMFAGYGGGSFALKKLEKKFECVGYSEIDKFASQCYEQNHKAKAVGDCTKINPNELDDFDLLTGGFPCQSFSVAGKGLGESDPRGTLFWDIIRVAEVKQPKYMLLENVKGLLSKKHKETFNKILGELDRIGYDVFWKVCNTKKHGIPQNRDRIFFVCFRKDLNCSPNLKSKNNSPESLNDERHGGKQTTRAMSVDINDNIEDSLVSQDSLNSQNLNKESSDEI